MFRPPLKGVRKRLDTKPTSGGIDGVNSRDAPEYKRITEMISELVWRNVAIEKRVPILLPPPCHERTRISHVYM